ncbi:MAG: DUF4869 domain-containing protein [Succinivibrionaceae bacterium]|nr:DUF4869 domain-containing protein [Succinivibrionaceae bacterium]
MLHVWLGDRTGEVYNPSGYFINQYDDEWITATLSREMIKDVDQSEVISERIIDSPVLGPITPRELSGGVQTLMLMAYDDSGKVFNASACGDNCAKWILKIAEKKELTVTLHHIMDFGSGPFNIEIMNTKTVVHNRKEYVDIAVDFV